MTETNAENRFFADEFPDFLDNFRYIRRITGTILKKNAIGIHLKNIFCLCIRGNDCQAAAFFVQ